MSNWYIYYRLLHVTHNFQYARTQIQDILCDLRDKARQEWPNLSESGQDVQDWFEYLSTSPMLFTEWQARHLTIMEPWAK